MSAQTETRTSLLGNLWQWVENKLIQDVPESIAECEFECRRLECRQEEWETCEKKMRHIAQAKARATSS